jgi:hypothetical protein
VPYGAIFSIPYLRVTKTLSLLSTTMYCGVETAFGGRVCAATSIARNSAANNKTLTIEDRRHAERLSVARESVQDNCRCSHLIFKGSGTSNTFPTFDVFGWFELRFILNSQLSVNELLPITFEITFRIPGTFTTRVKHDHRVGVFLLVGSVEDKYSILALLFPADGRLKGRDIKSFCGLR